MKQFFDTHTMLEAKYKIFSDMTESLKNTGLPWFVVKTLPDNDSLFEFDIHINGLILPGKIEKPVYMCKTKFINKLSICEFTPINFTAEKNIVNVSISNNPSLDFIEVIIVTKIDEEEVMKKHLIKHSPKVSLENIIMRLTYDIY